jgi:hypothetical protein
MSEKNKQEISEISDSFVQQANGDINIYGLGYKDVKDICHDVVRQELSIVTKEAVDTFHREILNFEDQFIDRLEKLENPQVAGKLATPKLQFVLHDTLKEYAKTDDTNTKEELVDLMIERLRVDEHTTEQHLIDESIKVLPNLSLPQAYFLGVLTLRKVINHGFVFGVNFNLKNRALLYKYLNNISNLDIHYLKLLNCCADMSMTRYYKPIIDRMKNDYDLLFRHSITEASYNSFLHDHPNLNVINGKPVVFKDGESNDVKLIYSSRNYLMQMLQLKDLQNTIPEIDKLIELFTPFSNEEIKDYLISLHHDWQKAFDCLDKEEVTHIDLTPVGTFIGRRVIKKITNDDTLPLEVFYK